MRVALILSNNNLLDYDHLEMSLGPVSNILVSVTFRGVRQFVTLHLHRRLHYHTYVVICRLIACTVLVPKSGAIKDWSYTSSGVVMEEQQYLASSRL